MFPESASKAYRRCSREVAGCKYITTHRLQSSSFLWFIFRILKGIPKKELLWSLWVDLKTESHNSKVPFGKAGRDQKLLEVPGLTSFYVSSLVQSEGLICAG